MQTRPSTSPLSLAPASSSARRCLLPFVFALLYASVLTSFPLEAFQDRANYLIYASHSDQIMADLMSMSPSVTLANEPVWLLFNIGISKLFDPDDALRILIFFPAFIVPWLILKHNHRHALWLILLFLLPQILKNHIIHLRQGLALSVFLLGYFSENKWHRSTLMLTAGLIHSSFLFIVTIFVIVRATNVLSIASRQRIAIQLICFALLGAVTMTIASSLGARQGSEYYETQIEFSGLGFMFWSTVLILLLSAQRQFLQKNITSISIITFYLATYFTLPVSARIFESGLALVCISGLELSGWRRLIFLVQMLIYGLVQYSMRLGSEWLGWGINY